MREAATALTGPPERPAGDYGNPHPEWRRGRLAPPPAPRRAAGQLGQLRRDRRGRAADLRPRALGLLAELAGEPAPLRPQPPGDRPRPPRLRGQPDAGLEHRHPGLRAPPARLLREARDRALRRRGRQLDGGLRLDRGGDPAAGALRAPDPCLGRRHDPRPGPQRAGGPARQGGEGERSGDRPLQPCRPGPPASPLPRVPRPLPPPQPPQPGAALRAGRAGDAQPRLRRRAAGAGRLRPPRPGRRDRDSDPGPVGLQRPDRAGPGRAQLSPPHPPLPAGDLRANGAPPPARAPRPLQPGARRVPRAEALSWLSR